MKKTTLMVLLSLSSAICFAKGGTGLEKAATTSVKTIRNAGGKHLSSVSTQSRIAPHSNQINSAFYTEDFSGGAIPSGWSNVDNSGNGMVWVFTTTGSALGEELNPTGTSAANGYLKFDSDSAGSASLGEDGILTTSAINCTGHSIVHISFNEFFRQYNSSTAILSMSTDNSTWTEIYHAETGLLPDSATPNAHLVDLDITAAAANQAAVYFRFQYTGTWEYYWFIDDVTLFEPSQFDAGVTSVDLPFNSCSLSATEPITVSVKNFGVDPISNFDVSYMVNFGTPVTETFTGTLNSGDEASYTFTQTADLSSAAVYEVDAFTGLVADGNNLNDSSFNITASYAHIDPIVGYNMGFEPGEDFSAYTTEYVDGDAGSIGTTTLYANSGTTSLVKFGSGANDDKWAFTQCVDLVSGGVNTLSYYYKNYELATPCSLEVYLGNDNSSTAMTVSVVQNPIPADTSWNLVTVPLIAAPGTYFIGFHFYSTTGGTSAVLIDDISLSFDNKVNENQVSSLISVFPNPSTGLVNILNRNTNEKKFALTVYNSIGAVVMTNQYDDLTSGQIDLSNQPSGIYSVQLRSASTTVNKSVVISNK